MNQEKYLALRRKYPVFEYTAYHWSTDEAGLRLCFDFKMGDVEFHPMALVERRPFLDFSSADAIDSLVYEIGLVELVSYWKCACPPLVRVSCGVFDAEREAFWRKLYWHGLGEFFYTNGISTTQEEFVQFAGGSGDSGDCGFSGFSGGAAYLVPVGGGKDSVVTLELLRRAGKTVRPLIMNPRGATIQCARVAGFPLDEALVIRRTIDPTLLSLNAEGYLNGHTPFSAMLAFYTTLASLVSGIPNVALSNENSANESTVLGTTVNHQYSKSLEFEDDFRAYCHNVLKSDCNYFSFLRPLSELQIAMLFSRFTAYHDVFRSCNVGSKQDIWCGHCAKCLFAYIILAPFVAPARLNAIFGKAMLDDTTLLHELRQLLGLAETKPFECVGTVGEVRQALSMAVARWYPAGRPALLNLVAPEIPGFPESPGFSGNLGVLGAQGNLSAEEHQILQTACTEKNN